MASHLAWWVVCRRWICVKRYDSEWWLAALNYAGSILFMLSAVGDFTLPTTGDVVNITWVNTGTFFGAIAFLVGAYLLLPPREPPNAASRVSTQ